MKIIGLVLYILLLFVVYAWIYYQNAIGVKRSVSFDIKAENGFKSPAFAERINIDEYEKQKIEYTAKEVRKLQESEEYKLMMKEKGKKLEQWNW